MSTVFSFQSQLVSIMDALSKTAVMEISKLVELESKMLKIEITRGRNEIASLRVKLQLMEKLFYSGQGGRQETPTTSSMTGEICQTLAQAPQRTASAIKSENTSENTRSSTRNSDPGDEHPPPLPSPHKEQPGSIVVKEEPLDVYNEQDMTCENRREAVNQRSQDEMPLPKPISEQRQTLFTESFVTVNTPPSLPQPGRKETHWSAQLTPPHQNLEPGKSIAQNVALQSLSVLRSMKLHNLRTSAAKRFGCMECGKSFRCFSQLEIHQRSHTGEKPFRCTLCGKRYAQKGHLYTHQRTHTGEKPYRCPICGKGFIQKCTLDMHQRTHTGEKPFVCVKCGKGFTKNCNLKKHLAVHLDPNLNAYGSQSSTSAFSGTLFHGTS